MQRATNYNLYRQSSITYQYTRFQAWINRYIFQSITMQRTESANVIHESGRAGKFPEDFPTSIALLIRVCETRNKSAAPASRVKPLRRAA